ncbi:MAG: HD domain-containing protein [Lachnospiraceae bacterium]|nr:HD domain-containing protein [Lachnospiraceae bacterium]
MQQIVVNKQKTREAFASYVQGYDATNPKVDLKIRHTTKVAELSEDIAKTVKNVHPEVAWLIGMMHDIGRFEQLRKYDTFIDSQSVDHAAFGCELLFQDRLCETMYEERALDAIVETAVSVHSMYRIPETVPDEILPYAKILRDADKIDIIRANMETPLTDIYNVTHEELYGAEVTKEVLEQFKTHSAIPRALKKAAVDHVVGHISLTFELEYPRSLQIMKEQGWLTKMMNFPSENEITRQQFAVIREIMQEFLA